MNAYVIEKIYIYTHIKNMEDQMKYKVKNT